VGAARGIIAASPELAAAPGLKGVASIPSTDVVAIRLFLDQPAALPNASNVFAGFNLRRRRSGATGSDGSSDGSTRDIAGTFFDLCALHDEYKPGARGAPARASTNGTADNSRDRNVDQSGTPPPVPGAVFEVDLYNASSVLDRSDEVGSGWEYK